MSYTNGKIYKIVSNQTDKIYIGSTIQTLEDRFISHKSEYNTYLKSNKNRLTSFELCTYSDCNIVLIELFPCECRTELERREGDIQLENINIIVNKCIAGRTYEEWYVDNRDKIIKHNTQWQLDNKEKVAKWRLDNKDKIAKYKAKYYLDNKEKNIQQRKDNKLKFVV